MRRFHWSRGPGLGRASAEDWFAESQALLAELNQAGPGGTFWHYTNQLDLLTGRNVLRLALGLPVDRDDLPRILRLADTALVRSPSPVEADSMVSRFEQLRVLLKRRRPRAGHPQPRGADAPGASGPDDDWTVVQETVEQVCRRVAAHQAQAR